MTALRLPAWIVVAVMAAFALLTAIVASHMANARLVRGDPDRQVSDPHLMRAVLPAGKHGFARSCAVCHGADGKGNGAGVPDLTDKDFLYGGQASDIQNVIVHGIRAPDSRTWRLATMPAFGETEAAAGNGVQPLAPNDIRDIMAFLWTLERRPADPAAALRGKALFSGRGNCFDCHSDDASGDPSIGAPNLRDNIWLYGGDQASVYRSITLGRKGVCPSFGRRLSPVSIRQITLYAYSLSHPRMAGGAS